MKAPRFRRRVLGALTLGVALPALLLASLGVFLTLRIARSVQNDTIRYNSYLGQQVAEAFELELMDHLKREMAPAENAARDGQPVPMIVTALNLQGAEFSGAHFVPVDDLTGISLIIAEGEPMLFAPGDGRREGQYFCGRLLRDPDGNVIGAGGWWLEPRGFLRDHMEAVVQERMPMNPRMYGGIELTRRVSLELVDDQGGRVARVREPGDDRTARVEPMAGPFERFAVRVAVTPDAPVVWTGRFLVVEIGFIIAMALVVLLATYFGYRYTIRQLELAQMKAGFISNVTHELKTPIAMVRLAIETLEMGRARDPQDTAKFLGIISRETDRLQRLVESILDFARLEAGQMAFRFAKVEVKPLVEGAVESLKPRLDHLGFELAVDVPDDLPRIRADQQAIQHCVLNLLDNAIKYSRDRRHIGVRASRMDGGVAISVADQGIGIAPGDRRRIFEKFVRLEDGLVHDVRGAGLGLSLVDQIVRAHQGRIEVESTPGAGSTFTIVLPSAEGVIGAGAETADADAAGRTGS